MSDERKLAAAVLGLWAVFGLTILAVLVWAH